MIKRTLEEAMRYRLSLVFQRGGADAWGKKISTNAGRVIPH